MKTYTRVEALVYSMLTENTGKQMLDSGGTDGRIWQRNQAKTIEDFYNEPEESYQFDYENGEVIRTVSVFHYLTNNLELDEVCERFNKIQDSSDNWDSDVWWGTSEEASCYLHEVGEVVCNRTWNTYNGDSDLSQILQGATILIDDEYYWLIQIHGGADARVGYTNAKLFKGGDYCEGMVHEYLWEHKDSYEIEQDIEEGYIDIFEDYWDASVTYTNKEVQDTLEFLEWIEGDDVVKNEDEYTEQSTQYRKKYTKEQLFEFFVNEFK